MHFDQGIILVGNFYRPPDAYAESIESLRVELKSYESKVIGVLLMGDFNVHHCKWLRFSNANTSSGELLHEVCQEFGLLQHVKEPTRGNYLLDLVISDFPQTIVKLSGMLADHKVVIASVPLAVSEAVILRRRGWDFKHARWHAFKTELRNTDWTFTRSDTIDEAVEKFTLKILIAAQDHIPLRIFSDNKSQHPWLNNRCRTAISKKHASEGTPNYNRFRNECSVIITDEYLKHLSQLRKDVAQCKRGSKKWWKLNALLLNRKSKACSIPALKMGDEWFLQPEDKANILAIVWEMKQTLPPAAEQDFHLSGVIGTLLDHVVLHPRWFLKQLLSLDISKATGPDALPARILKEIAHEIFEPFACLCTRIVEEGHWPNCWREHNLVPIYKRLSVFDPNHYRGVHIIVTAVCNWLMFMICWL